VDTAVGDQLGDRQPGDLAADRVEARQDDGLGRVIDDQVDSGRLLEARMLRPSRPMIRPFISSDGRCTTETVCSAV